MKDNETSQVKPVILSHSSFQLTMTQMGNDGCTTSHCSWVLKLQADHVLVVTHSDANSAYKGWAGS